MDCIKNKEHQLGVKNNHTDESPSKQKLRSEIFIVGMRKENYDKRASLKRKRENYFDDYPVREPKVMMVDDIPKAMSTRNALSTLHEMFRTLNVKIISQDGPENSPVFTASIEINGIQYFGQGKNKKMAKHAAAEVALKSIVQLKNPDIQGELFNKIPTPDFSEDAEYKDVNNFDVNNTPESCSSVSNGARDNGSCSSQEGKNLTKSDIKNNKSLPATKNPVMLLNELHPAAKYELVSDDGSQSTKFTMAVYVGDQRFEGRGSSKKLSKAAAARSALSLFYNVVVPDSPAMPIQSIIPMDNSSLPQKFADHVAQLVLNKFDLLVPTYSSVYRRKVLAGFVLSENYDLGSCTVLTVSTGTKCINGEKMSVNGTVLNDSHAEIISRRGLCNYFFNELEKLADEKESIFMPKEGGGYQLKPQYKIHLFINTAPCGDARIFSPYDTSLADKHPNRKARGQLRTKIECGEGTIPVKSFFGIQTWDGVLLGERLLTMSCSDKLAKWNVVGLQGALLSNFIEPIYLDSIILGSLFHPCHLYRAICGRIESSVSGLNPPFLLNKPRMSGTINTEKRQTGKTPNMSVNWSYGEKTIEVINAVTGRTDQNVICRVAKCKLFYKFLHLLEKLPTTTGLTKPNGPLLYSLCKESARDFQAAKKVLYSAMVKAQLGEWVKKPLEVDQFEWDIESLERLFESDAATAVTSKVLNPRKNAENKTE